MNGFFLFLSTLARSCTRNSDLVMNIHLIKLNCERRYKKKTSSDRHRPMTEKNIKEEIHEP